MTTTPPDPATRQGLWRRPGWATTGLSAVVALALVAVVIIGVSVGEQDTAAAAPPVVGEPGVLPPVDLSSLNPDPIKQWGVVGEGNSYTAAKSQVWDFQEIGNRIYVAGIFTGVQRNGDDPTSTVISQPYLAAFDRDSGAWIPTFTPQLDRAVYALETSPNGNLLVGGEFTTVNGVARTGLVMLDPITGATVPGFGASISAASQPMVRDILRVGSQIYVAGQISGIQSGSASPFVWNAARLDGNTGAYDPTWVPKFMGGIWQVAVDQSRGRVHAAGFFTSVDGQPKTARFASVTESTGAYIPGLSEFVTNDPNGQTDTVAVVYADNKIWVGGAQHVIQVLDPVTNARLGYETTGINCNTFSPSCGYIGGGDFQTLEVAAGGLLLGGCHCYTAGTAYSSFSNTRVDNRFAVSYDTATGYVASTFVPGLKQRSVGTYAIFTDTRGCYYVGGDYTRQADGDWLGGFARFCRTVQPPVNPTATSSNAGARFTWTAPDAQLPVAYYKVYKDGVFAGDTTGTVYGFSGLTVGASATFTVRTMDVAGRLSAPVSATVTIAGADTTAPEVPANAAGTVTNSSVALTWNPSVDLPKPGGVGLSGYLIHRDYNFVKLVPAGTQSFTDVNVPDGPHRYEVRAVDLANNISAPAPAVNVTVGVPDTTPPVVPANAAGTVTGSSVALTWNPSADLPTPGGVGLSGYLIHRDYNFVKFVPAGTQSFTDVNVPDGPHRYEVRAVDLASNISAPAPAINVTVGVPDTVAPTVPGNAAGTVAGSSVVLTWSASSDLPSPGGVGLSGYLIHRDWNFVKFVPAGTLTFTDPGVASGPHRYEVRAVDLANNISAPAAPVLLTVP
ncbi:MAG: hypothetical protein U0Q22_03040 [Acidimicrobiales bacterium]